MHPLRFRNLLFALMTFGLGLGFAGLFSTPEFRMVGCFRETPSTDISMVSGHEMPPFDSDVCIDVSGRGFAHSERDALLADKIHKIEVELSAIRKSQDRSPTIEKRMQELEIQLKLLEMERQTVLRKRFVELPDRNGGTKLVYRQSCYDAGWKNQKHDNSFAK